MTRLSAKKSIAHLVSICALKGIRHAIISPGSRNAPLTISLDEHPDIQCINIPDERVAGFFALGMAQELEFPVILCCTSGSAGLNYAPALVEAYYQKVSLLVLTADRPPQWIDQRAGQTMRQHNMFSNYVKASHTLICDPQDAQGLWYNDRLVNQAIDESHITGRGPVHINIPLHEPLYDTAPLENYLTPKIVHTLQRRNVLSEETKEDIIQNWNGCKKIIVIVGQHTRSAEFDRAVEKLATISKVVVLTETTSNVVAEGVYRSIDRLIDSMHPDDYESFAPDLVISCGGALVSKKLRFMLREMNISQHWHVDSSDRYIDTYQSLTLNIPMMLEELVPILTQGDDSDSSTEWKQRWISREKTTKSAHELYLKDCVWSDLLVLSILHEVAPSGLWHVANSTPVRYTQLFETRVDLTYRANRGVSGIDGCTSTAMGAAFLTDKIVTLVTGDIAFFYDSNAFWHNHVPPNFRVIMINNEGGNIFRYVKGPLETAQFEKHFEAHHKTSAEGIAMAYAVEYKKVSTEVELRRALKEIYAPEYNQAIIVEVCTPREKNIDVLKDYFKFLKTKVH